ncbi:MAG: type 1 glutamine amidotransferase [Acidobacteria bacterium]|nr:MAG: type 1 glutamine amidotransferase [Acidobacteriota bacterium]
MMKLKGKRVALLVEDLYQEMEVWYPLYRLKEEGADITVIGTTDVHKSKLGYPVKVDLRADRARAADFDIVIIPGGYAPDRMRRHRAMIDFVRQAHQQGKIVAAICHGLWLAISAGILRGKTVTGFFSIKDDIVNAGATYVDEPVVTDGRLITSRVPDDLPAFCREIIAAAAGEETSARETSTSSR